MRCLLLKEFSNNDVIADCANLYTSAVNLFTVWLGQLSSSQCHMSQLHHVGMCAATQPLKVLITLTTTTKKSAGEK